MIMKRLIVFALAAAVYGTSGLNTALSQAYPSRPITLIVPYPAGGPTDSLARLLTEHMRVLLGQSIELLRLAGYFENQNERRLMDEFRRSLLRIRPTAREVTLWLGAVNQVRWKLTYKGSEDSA